MAAATDIDEYIAGFPEDVQAILTEIRARLHAVVPDAEERIRYGMPALMLGGRYAIHFAAWKKHVGLYPVPELSPALEERLAPLRSGADSVNLVYAKPIPYDLVEEVGAAIVALRRS